MASAWSQLDQLLTCAICLDRYRNPKLLPCQHTFCMEPCLDGLIDYARRQIKCPECRAEHRIPYQGIQQYPTNVTLMRFLELHRDITGEEPEPPPSMMERCNVCSEKANVERCAHCEKKICPDCKEAHVDILRREINRINNQVRRGLHRLSEALNQTKKNAEKLQVNCKQVKEEIDDIVKRYSKDLKITEDKLKNDLEVYTQSEMKAITKLKEDLEIEVTNISSNCDLVDKYIKDDYEWSDLELLEYKQIFLKMLDFLRTFDPDNTDFSRRIKFQPRADPDVLHRNIADFGELKINAPMNAVPTQQSLMPPTSNALMRSQSDHRLAAQFARRCDNRSFADANQRMDGERPTSPLLGRNRRDDGYRRYSERSKDYDYQDRSTSRYSREDTALSSRWRDGVDDYTHRNRYNRDYEDCDSEPHQSRTVRFADEQQQQRERIFDIDEASKGPLSGVIKLLDSPKVMERLHQNEVKQKQQQTETSSTEVTQTTQTITPSPVTTPKRQTPRQQSEDDIDRQKKANQQASSSMTSPQTEVSTNISPRKSNVGDTLSESPRPSEPTEASDPSRSRRRLSGTTSFDESTNESSHRIPSRQVSNDIELEIKETEVGISKEEVGLRDTNTPRRHAYTRHQSDTRYDRLNSAISDQDSKQESNRQSPNFLFNDKPSIPTRRLTLDDLMGQERPNYNRYRSNEAPGSTYRGDGARSPSSRYSPLCRRTFVLPTISSLEPTSNDESCCSSDSSANIFFSCNSSLEDFTDVNLSQSMGQRYCRSALVKTTSLDAGDQSRKPSDKKLPPRAATPLRQNDSEESEDEDDEDDDETYQIAKEPPKPVQSSFFNRQRRLPEPEPRLLEMHESQSDEDEEEESESEEENDIEEPVQSAVAVGNTGTNNTTESDGEEEEEEEEDEEEDEEEESSSTSVSENESKDSEDQVVSKATVPNSISDKPSNVKSNDPGHTNFEPQSDDSSESESEEQMDCNGKDTDEEKNDKEEFQSRALSTINSVPRRRSSINFESNIPRGRKRSDDTDTTDSSTASSSTNYHSFDTPLGASNNTTEDRISSEGSSNNDSIPSRFRRRPFLARSRSSHEIALGFNSSNCVDDDDDEEESPAPIITDRSRSKRLSEDISKTKPSGLENSTTSNNCWATYLNNKYGSNAAGRIVPRSKSSHSLYQKSDSESSDDETTTGPALSSSYAFSNPRSTYMQKRRMMLKIGSRGSEPGNFTWPRGVAVGPDNSIVVADSSNHRIQVFDSIGKFSFEFGTYGSGEGDFDCLAGVSVNRIGQFIVSDRYNSRVQLFDPTGRFLRAFGCEGRTDGRFNYPWGIATDSLGFIYVCDKENHRIQVFQSDGTFVGKFGSLGSRPGQLEHPHYIAVTNTNRVVVTDTNNHRVQIFDVNGRSLTTFGSEGSEEGHFKFPKGIAVDDQGYIIVADSGNNRIQIFQPDGSFLRCFGTWGTGNGEFKGLEGLAVTTGGSIIACDRENHRIQVF